MERETEHTKTSKESVCVVNISDSDVEDGEILERDSADYLKKVSCLYFQEGRCNLGKACRFLHLSDKGLYTMFNPNEQPTTNSNEQPTTNSNVGFPSVLESAPQIAYGPEEKVQTEWDIALNESLERVKKSGIKKKPSTQVEKLDDDVEWIPKSPPLVFIYDSESPDCEKSPPLKRGKYPSTGNVPKNKVSKGRKRSSDRLEAWRRSKSPLNRKRTLSSSSNSSCSISSSLSREKKPHSSSSRAESKKHRCSHSTSGAQQFRKSRRKRSTKFRRHAWSEEEESVEEKKRSKEHHCRKSDRQRCRLSSPVDYHRCSRPSRSTTPIYVTMYSSSERNSESSRRYTKVRSPYELSLKKEILSSKALEQSEGLPTDARKTSPGPSALVSRADACRKTSPGPSALVSRADACRKTSPGLSLLAPRADGFDDRNNSDMSISPVSEPAVNECPKNAKKRLPDHVRVSEENAAKAALVEDQVFLDASNTKKCQRTKTVQPQSVMSDCEQLLSEDACSEKLTSQLGGEEVLKSDHQQPLDPFEEDLLKFKAITSFLSPGSTNCKNSISTVHKKEGSVGVHKIRSSVPKLSKKQQLEKLLAEVTAAINRKRTNNTKENM